MEKNDSHINNEIVEEGDLLFKEAQETIPIRYSLDEETHTITDVRFPTSHALTPKFRPTGAAIKDFYQQKIGSWILTSYQERTARVSASGEEYTVYCVPVRLDHVPFEKGASDLAIQPGEYVLDNYGNLCKVLRREPVRDIDGLGLWEEVTCIRPDGQEFTERIGPTPSPRRAIRSIVVGFKGEK